MKTIHIDNNSTARGKAIQLVDQTTELTVHDLAYRDFVDIWERAFLSGHTPVASNEEDNLLNKFAEVNDLFGSLECSVSDLSYELRQVDKKLGDIKTYLDSLRSK